MEATDYRPGQRRQRRRRGGRRRFDNNNRDSSQKPKQNPILAFFGRLFGGGRKKALPAPDPANRADRMERPEPADRGERGERGDRGDRGGRDRRDRDRRRDGREGREGRDSRDGRQFRQDAEAPVRDEVFRESAEPAPEGGGDAPQDRREPEQMEVTTPRLYVGNLSYDSGESDLFELFSQAGQVRNVEVAREREGHRSKGFGFVEMDSIDTARTAQQRLNGYEWMGRALIVSGAKAPATRGFERDRGGRDRERRR